MVDRDLDVVVVGNVGVDTNVYVAGEHVNWQVESNFTQNLDCVGQAGGYSSRGFAQLGRRTAFLGYVGDDHNGCLVRSEFERDGIDMAGLMIDPAGTSRSVNLVYPDGRRKNFYDGKGNPALQPDLAFCRKVLARAWLAHFHIPNWARALLPVAKELGLTVACDLQDVVSAEDAYRLDFVQAADILFFSAVNHPDPGPLLETYLAGRPRLIVLVGMGSRGCALGTSDGVRYFPPVEMDRAVVDTNGAGDGLAVGFLTSYVLDGYDLEDSVLRGQIAARHTCSLKATSSELISPEELEAHNSMLRHQI
jgi:sugar/nucleoside kinase (ribokinase family)